jgi:hypothetical protein
MIHLKIIPMMERPFLSENMTNLLNNLKKKYNFSSRFGLKVIKTLRG